MLWLDGVASSVSPDSLWWPSIFSISCRSHSHDSRVNSTADAILLLQVELGDVVVVKGHSSLNVSLRGGINNILDLESLDGLVLG